MSIQLGWKSLLLPGLAARALAYGHPAHQLQREGGCRITKLGRYIPFHHHSNRHYWDRRQDCSPARLSCPGLPSDSTTFSSPWGHCGPG